MLFISPVLAAENCDGVSPTPDLQESYSDSWGIDHRNRRYQSRSTINADNVGPLSLEGETGCGRWFYDFDGIITSAVLAGIIDDREFLIFAARFSGVYIVDALEGTLVRHLMLEEEPIPLYSGAPLVTDDLIFVPIASMEIGLSANPFYGCCTTKVGMAAFNMATGDLRWYLPTIEEQAKVTGSHFFFVQEHGPNGAPVRGAPAYDEERDFIFYGTRQNYTHPTTKTSDAIFAVEASTGKARWVVQFTENDAFTAACNISMNHPNFAKPTGPDIDFGAPTLLARTPCGVELLLAGQKSADVYAMNPDTGEVVWSKRLGRGGIIGGIHRGLSVNEAVGLVFVPISHKQVMGFRTPGLPAPRLYA